ncbi:phosphotriesterase [Lysinibacillus sp. FSL K6-4013]|uniref:phosphotriesterase family protein n=1 Tax=Lysinibacillus sp. FSL K6-4013 TaxID=2921504 RepID=UPI00315A44AD
MTKIYSVTGELQLTDLGTTLIHEHLLLRSEEVTAQFPHLYDEADLYDKAVTALKEVKQRGIDTICDPTVMGIGRDVDFMKRVSEETNVQVIAATGVYSFNEIPPHFANREIDYLAQAFIHDIEKGIQGTDIKASFLKCAADAKGITEDLDKVFRAVARAHKATGVPIMTHSHPASKNGLNQIRIFEEEGVDFSKVMIGHCGDTEDLDYLHEILNKGVFIGMDRYSQGPLSIPKRNITLMKLIEQGYSNKMFLSQDYCCSIDWFDADHEHYKNSPEWSITYLTDKLIPALLEKGVSQGDIDLMMKHNVIDWFTGQK